MGQFAVATLIAVAFSLSVLVIAATLRAHGERVLAALAGDGVAPRQNSGEHGSREPAPVDVPVYRVSRPAAVERALAATKALNARQPAPQPVVMPSAAMPLAFRCAAA